MSELFSAGSVAVVAFAYWIWTRMSKGESAPESAPGGGEDDAPTPDPTPPSDPSATLNGPPSVEQHVNEATRAANTYGVPRDLILAVIWQESAGDKTAVGSAGEQGLMQVTQIAAEDVDEPLPSTSASVQRQITVGTKYLKKCIKHYAAGDQLSGLRTYNEGPPPHTQEASKKYAREVLSKLSHLKKPPG